MKNNFRNNVEPVNFKSVEAKHKVIFKKSSFKGLLILLLTSGLVHACADNPNPVNVSQVSAFGFSPEQNKILSFKKYDINNDNFISVLEYKKSQKKDFASLDLNKDKKLGFQEWINNESTENYSKYLQEWVLNEGNPSYLRILKSDSENEKNINKNNLINNTYIESTGTNSGKGNIIAVQPYVSSFDYANQRTFYANISSYLDVASQKGLLNPKTIVVFPDYTGTWLVAAGEKSPVYNHPTINGAIRRLAFYNFFDFIWSFITEAKSKEKLKETVFRIKSERMAKIYNDTFSELAKKYKVTIVAGSIILPGPEIKDGVLSINKKLPLNNISVVYKPDGIPESKIIKKVYPVETEKNFITSSGSGNLPVFDTPAGKLGVLISDDSWYPQNYSVLKYKGAQLIAVPAYLNHNNANEDLWTGYNGSITPKDIEVGDVGKIKEQQAWLKYALPARLEATTARVGVTTYLRGNLWDMGSDGSPLLTVNNQTKISGSFSRFSSLSNIWL